VLRRIFGPKRDEVTGDCRRLRNKELYGLYSSPNIIRVIKSRIMRWAGHVLRMGRGEAHTGFWYGDLREGGHLEDPRIDGRVILNLSSRSGMGGMDWIYLAQDRYRWRVTKFGEFLD
jgi:hypothetical protein